MYSDSEWLEDYEFLQSLCASGTQPLALKTETSKYFFAKYQDEYVSRYARFFEAMKYLDRNIERFDFASAAVVASKEALVSTAVVLGLRDYFCSLPNSALMDEPSHDEVLACVRKRLPE